MRKRMILGVLLALAGMLSVAAQDAENVIRKHYAEAQQKVAEYDKAEKGEGDVFPQYYEVNIVQNLPGTGPHHKRVRMYYYEYDNEDWQPDEPMLTRSLQFVTVKYNYAAREFYEEYLYDEKGQIEFVYYRDADIDDVGGECRLYYKNGKLFRALVSIFNPETETYEQKYSGATMPEKYEGLHEGRLYNIKKYKTLFDELDIDTFH